MTDTTKKTTSTPAEIAQRSLDAAQKKVDKATADIKKAEAELATAKAAKTAAEEIRDFRRTHPALKKAPVEPTVTSVSSSPDAPDMGYSS